MRSKNRPACARGHTGGHTGGGRQGRRETPHPFCLFCPCRVRSSVLFLFDDFRERPISFIFREFGPSFPFDSLLLARSVPNRQALVAAYLRRRFHIRQINANSQQADGIGAGVGIVGFCLLIFFGPRARHTSFFSNDIFFSGWVGV